MQSIEKVMHFVKEILAGIVTVGISRYLELKWSFTHYVPMFRFQKQPFTGVLQIGI